MTTARFTVSVYAPHKSKYTQPFIVFLLGDPYDQGLGNILSTCSTPGGTLAANHYSGHDPDIRRKHLRHTRGRPKSTFGPLYFAEPQKRRPLPRTIGIGNLGLRKCPGAG